jgi:peptidoglycan/LPS O-acetylase OafA/YrhL
MMAISFVPHINQNEFNEKSEQPITYPFRASLIYVDTFFVISGLLLSYTVLGRLQKSVKVSYKKEIMARYLRMAPPLAAVVIFSAYLLPYVGEGPQVKLYFEKQLKSITYLIVSVEHQYRRISTLSILLVAKYADDSQLFRSGENVFASNSSSCN